jgi:hypothetical protein
MVIDKLVIYRMYIYHRKISGFFFCNDLSFLSFFMYLLNTVWA